MQIAAPRLDLEDIQSHVVPEGLLAALTLLRCVSSRRALAKLLATKTSLPVTCVNLMSGTSRGRAHIEGPETCIEGVWVCGCHGR